MHQVTYTPYSMLIALILIPLLGAGLLGLLSGTTRLELQRIKQVALIITVIEAALSVSLVIGFDLSVPGYQYVSSWSDASFLNLSLGVDGISLLFVLLTTLLTPVCLLASWRNVTMGVKAYFQSLLVIEALLVAVFVVLDLLLFYVCFEAVLVPLFLLVGVWGGSPTRTRSALLLFLYTLTGSLFMLLAILQVRVQVGTTDFDAVALADIDPQAQRILWLGFWLALMTKTPMVPVHIWLPRAHADAPLAGSMLLAGVVLKLATYGMVRVLLTMLPDASSHFTPLVQVLALISLVYASLATVRQVDIKSLVAYSSVAHMAVVVLGLFSNSLVGIQGALVLSLAHGVVSPALFMLVGGVLYDRYHTRTIRYYRGLVVLMPVFATLFFLATCANMGVPLTGNWLAEVMSLAGAFQRSPVVGLVGASGIVLSACYSIWLWTRLVGGSLSPHLGYGIDMTRREVHVLLPLLVGALWLGIMPNTVLDLLHLPVSHMLSTT
jgi:NADH-ubiquinone oxidoreductase chain 4